MPMMISSVYNHESQEFVVVPISMRYPRLLIMLKPPAGPAHLMQVLTYQNHLTYKCRKGDGGTSPKKKAAVAYQMSWGGACVVPRPPLALIIIV